MRAITRVWWQTVYQRIQLQKYHKIPNYQPTTLSGIEPNRMVLFCYHTPFSFDHNWRIKILLKQEHPTGKNRLKLLHV